MQCLHLKGDGLVQVGNEVVGMKDWVTYMGGLEEDLTTQSYVRGKIGLDRTCTKPKGIESSKTGPFQGQQWEIRRWTDGSGEFCIKKWQFGVPVFVKTLFSLQQDEEELGYILNTNGQLSLPGSPVLGHSGLGNRRGSADETESDSSTSSPASMPGTFV